MLSRPTVPSEPPYCSCLAAWASSWTCCCCCVGVIRRKSWGSSPMYTWRHTYRDSDWQCKEKAHTWDRRTGYKLHETLLMCNSFKWNFTFLPILRKHFIWNLHFNSKCVYIFYLGDSLISWMGGYHGNKELETMDVVDMCFWFQSVMYFILFSCVYVYVQV